MEQYEAASCHYFTSGTCRSCSLLAIPSGGRLQRKINAIRSTFEERSISTSLLREAIIPSHPWESRRKIKMSVTGPAEAPVIGIVRNDLSTADLRDCPLTPKPIRELLHFLRDVISSETLTPYDITARAGDLKQIIVMSNATMTEAIVRFVLRSSDLIPQIRQTIPRVQNHFPWITVVSCNIQPLPAAILEGPTEIILTDNKYIREDLYDIPLYFEPQSFMQVTPEIAASLYRTAQEFGRRERYNSALDLFCGVGGFSLHLAPHVGSITGVELSQSAVTSASRSAQEAGWSNTSFIASDVEAFLDTNDSLNPDLVVVNPPRRGLSEGIIRHLLRLRPTSLIYSSCNPTTFARDAQALSGTLTLQEAIPFDMFPMTEHCEIMGLFTTVLKPQVGR